MRAGPSLRCCDKTLCKTISLEREVPILLCTKIPTNPLGSPDFQFQWARGSELGGPNDLFPSPG